MDREEQKAQFLQTLDKCIGLARSNENGEIRFDRKKLIRSLIEQWIYNEDEKFTDCDLRSAYGSYVFLFQKNIDVTNINLPEQLALLRLNRVSTDGNDAGHKDKSEGFFSTRQYRNYVERLITAKSEVFEQETDFAEYCSKISENLMKFHLDFFINTTAVSYYHSSFVAHIPRTLRFDLVQIVGESGYIHSVGRQVYVSKADNSSEGVLIQNLVEYAEKFSKGKKLYAAPYCSEFFANEGEITSYSMGNGLGQNKLSGRKHYVGNENILDFFAELGTGNSFMVPGSDNYFNERGNNSEEVTPDTSIFLFVDHGLGYSKTDRKLTKSDDIYYICYAQLLKFGNKFAVMKERKPGWTGPVTIPHTLSAAIVNVSRDKLESSRNVSNHPMVFDPFCGSSTFLLDAAVRMPNARLVGFDRQPLFHIMNEENFSFFSSGDRTSELKLFVQGAISDIKNDAITHNHVSSELSKFASNGWKNFQFDAINPRPIEMLPRVLAALLFGIEQARQKPIEGIGNRDIKELLNDESLFSVDLCAALEGCKSELARISFFIIWRSIVARAFRLRPGQNKQNCLDFFLKRILKEEFDDVRLELVDLEKIDHSGTEKLRNEKPESQFEVVDGSFSPKVRIRPEYLSQIMSKKNNDLASQHNFFSKIVPTIANLKSKFTLVHGDSLEMMRDLVQENSNGAEFRPDLIITDPPYNFNMHEGDMEELFHEISYSFSKLIAIGGVVTMVLPSFARNGRTIPFYQTKEVFVRRFLAHCNELGRQIVNYSESIPDTTTHPRLPYYWQSQRGVSRHVLSFMLR